MKNKPVYVAIELHCGKDTNEIADYTIRGVFDSLRDAQNRFRNNLDVYIHQADYWMQIDEIEPLISYRKHDDSTNREECYLCRFQKRGSDPSCFDWECELFNVYLGKYRAKRCQQCIDEFGDVCNKKTYGRYK